MAVTYPLIIPQITSIQSVSLGAVNAVVYQRSPFTFAGQAQASGGQMFRGSVILKPMRRSTAAQWVGFLVSLRGQFGTFLMGDPDGQTPNGTASIDAGTPVVNGAAQTGETLNISGAPLSTSGWLLVGDYIQLGAGATATLHQVTNNVDTDAGGLASIDLWPHITETPVNASTVVVSGTVGRWRLDSNQTDWGIDAAAIYGITFGMMQDV